MRAYFSSAVFAAATSVMATALAAPLAIELDAVVAGALPEPGGSATYSFAVGPGQRVYLDRVAASAVNTTNWELLDGYGRVIVANSTALDDMGPVSLVGGAYTLTVKAETPAAVGSFEFAVRSVTDGAASLSLGTPHSASIPGKGGAFAYQLALASTAEVYFDFSALTGAGGLNAELLDAAGNVFLPKSSSLGDFGPIPLPAGTYTLAITTEPDSTGAWTLQARATSKSEAAIALDTASTFAVVAPGDTGSLNLAVPSDRLVIFDVTGGTNTGALNWRLETDAGESVFDWTTSVADSARIPLRQGTYRLRFRGEVDALGSANFVVRTILDGSGQLTAGVGVPVSVVTPGQQIHLSAADLLPGRYVLYASPTSNANGLNWIVRDSAARTILPTTTSLVTVPDLALAGGDYTITVASEGDQVGTATVVLQPVTTQQFSTALGNTVSGNIAVVGGEFTYSFTAAIGQTVTIDVLSSSNTQGLNYELLDAQGRVLLPRTVALNDSAPVPLMGGGYVLRVVGEPLQTGTFSISLVSGTAAPFVPAGAPLTLGAVTSDTTTGTTPKSYVVAVAQPSRIYFDLISSQAGNRWTLRDAAGVALFNQAFAQSNTVDDRGPFSLAPGSYQLDVFNSSGTNAPYSFVVTATEVLDAPFELGQSVSASPANAGFLHTHRLALQEATRVAFDMNQGGTTLFWELRDAVGRPVFARNSALSANDLEGPFDLAAGDYALLIDGSGGATPAYSFRAIAAPLEDKAASLDTTVSDTLAVAGETHRHTFSVGAMGEVVYFDLLVGSLFLRWTLRDALGRVWFGPLTANTPTLDDLGPLSLPAGDYSLEIDATVDNTPAYSFRLVTPTVSQAAVQWDTPVPLVFPETGSAHALSFSLAAPTRGFFDLQVGASSVVATLRHKNSGWTPFNGISLGNDQGSDRGPFVFPAGDYELMVRAEAITNASPTFVLHTVLDEVVSPAPLNSVLSAKFLKPGQTITYLFEPQAPGDAITINLMSDAPENRWSLYDPVGAPVFLGATASNWSSHDRGPFPLAPGLYKLVINPDNDAFPSFQFRIEAPLVVTTIPEGCASCKSLDVVFVFDTSPSMNDDTELVCSLAAQLIGSLAERGIPVNANYWGISDKQGNPCASSWVSQELGTLLPGAPPAQFSSVLTCDAGGLPSENWAIATALVASAYPWEEGAVRLVVPASDEGAYCGDPTTALDLSAIEFATAVALDNATVVSPLVPATAPDPIVAQAELLAVPTSGISVRAGQSPEQILSSLTAVGNAACETVADAKAVPEVISVSPMPGSILPAGVPIVVSGQALPVNELRPLLDVTINGASAGAIDGAGHFFAEVVLEPGPNILQIAPVEFCGAFAYEAVLHGVDPNANPLDAFADVTTFLTPQFSDTTLDLAAGRSLVDVAAKNNGVALTGPILFAVGTDLHPKVQLVGPEGVTPQGEPYLTVVPEGEILASGATSGPVLLAFDNTSRERVDFTPRFLAPANLPPYFTSVPPFFAAVGVPFSYQPAVVDPNGHDVSFSLLVGPDGMSLSAGELTWTPTAAEIGKHSVSLRASDGLGGSITQTFSVEVLAPGQNAPPIFVSLPTTQTAVGATYAYAAKAIDPNGDTLQYALLGGPPGMQINASTGALHWPDAKAGQHSVVVEAADGQGGTATQAFVLFAGDASSNAGLPVITSTPPPVAAVEVLYRYVVKSTDPDGDVLSYLLVSGPPGMTLGAAAGVLEWTPALADLGTHPVSIQVSDGEGGITTQSFTLEVKAALPNQPPFFVTTPPLLAVAGGTFSYAAEAVDPEFAELTYALESGPPGMTMSPSGSLVWSPELGLAPQSIPITVSAADPVGAKALQSFVLGLKGTNTAPALSGTPPSTAWKGEVYTAIVVGSDPDLDPLSYSLAVAPAGMTVLPQFGLITWDTASASLGEHPVELQVTDGFGGVASLSFVVQLLADTTPPVVLLALGNQPCVGGTVQLCVLASDDVGLVSRSLIVSGVSAPLMGACAVVPVEQAGAVPVVLSAADTAGNSTSIDDSFVALDCSDEEKPTVTLISPSPESVINEITPLVVSISDNSPAQLTWTVTIRRGEDGTPTQIAFGSGEVVAAAVAQIDPTALVNDTYTVSILGSDGLQTGGVEFDVHMSGRFKPGRFQMAFNDLSIRVAGIPLSIGRVYDSIEAGSGATSPDLGPGWKLLLSGNVSDSPDDKFDELSQPMGFLLVQPFQLASRVYVTKPDGDRVGFTFAPKPKGGPVPFLLTPAFEPDPGVTDTLEAVGPPTVWVFGNLFYDYIIPYNPRTYILTTEEGVRYTLDEQSGLQFVEDVNGNTLEITAAGVFSSTGVALEYIRDAQGRVVEVVEPSLPGETPGSVKYAYDAAGNLVSMADAAGQTTHYVYAPEPNPHHLATVVDPLGRPMMRNVYDDAGRLVASCGPDGDISTLQGCTTLSHDVSGGLTTMFDGRGNKIELFYDEQGNVVLERRWLDGASFADTVKTYDSAGRVLTVVDPEGSVSEYVYDTKGRLVTETQPGGQIWKAKYGLCQDPVETCDPLGNCTKFTYDAQCRELTRTSPLGETTTTTYDSSGNILSFTDASGESWHWTYDSRGFPLEVVDPRGNPTSFQFSGTGELLSLTDRAGRTVSYTYDEAHRPLLEVWDTVPSTESAWQYNAAGQVTRVENAVSVLEIEYTPTGRVLQISHVSKSGGPPWWLRYGELGPGGLVSGYDGNDNIEVVEDSAGGRVEYSYDAQDRLIAAEQLGAGALRARVEIGVNKNGLPLSISRRSGQSLSVVGPSTLLAYGCGGCPASLESILHLAPGGAALHAIDIARNALHQVVGLTDAEGAHVFGYDGAGRLRTVDRGIGALPDEAYTYDAAGNRVTGHLTGTSILSTGTAAGGHQLIADALATYTYDVLGNLIERVSLASGEKTKLFYDVYNRLIGVEVLNAQGAVLHQAEYEYAQTGQRIRATVNGVDRWYAYDAENAVFAMDSAGQVVWRRLFGRAVDRPFAEETTAGLRWLLADHVGTIRDVTDSAGALVAHYAYDAFGRQVLGPAGSLDDSLRFAGREADVPGGLTYVRARAYAPELGRFVSEDPRKPWHYAYAENDPLRFVDPTGELAAIEYIGLLCDIGSMLDLIKTYYELGKGLEVVFQAVVDGMNGLPVDPQAVREALLKAIYGVVTSPIMPCGLPFPLQP
jgi:RHS repeat-associated protein